MGARAARAGGYALFFLLLFVPTAYTALKGGLMLGVLGAIAWRALRFGRLSVDPAVAVLTLLSITVSAFFMLRGLMNAAPGAFRVGTVYMLWPVVYTLFVAGADSERVLRDLVRVAVFATLAIGLYAMSYILHAIGWLPPALYLPLDQGQALGIYAGFMELNLYSVSSLLFLVPFVLTCLMTWPHDGRAPTSRIMLWLALASGMVVVLLSGRRALLLTVALSPFFALVLRALQPPVRRAENRRSLLVVVAVGIVGVLVLGAYLARLGITPAGIAEMFLEGFDFSGDYSAALRRWQLAALMDGWAASPLLGAGHGAAAPGLVRSMEMPWAYELSYAALLFHVGVVGFAAYTGALLWVCWNGTRLIRSGHPLDLVALPTLVGMLCFLIGNATNPYLEKFDYLWVLFLPVAIVNAWLLQRRVLIPGTAHFGMTVH